MNGLIRGLFFVVVFVLFSEQSFGQLRARVVASMNVLNHATCYGTEGDANVNYMLLGFQAGTVVGGYTLVVSKDGNYMTTLSSSVVQSSTSIAISLSALSTGDYTISGTVIAYNSSTSSVIGSYSTSFSFSVGYPAVWGELREMTAQATPSTVLQSIATPTQTYAGARTLNNDAGDFWFLITPTFNSGNATNRSIFVPLFYTLGLGTFSPTSFTHFIEFRKAGSDPTTGDGVYYKSPAGTVKLDGVTYTSKLRVTRTAGTIMIYTDGVLFPLTYTSGGTSTLFSVTNNATSALSVHTKVINDGVNVVTNLKCNSSADAYATLFDETDGYYYTVKEGKLRFVFNQNYDTQNNLKFNIYNSLGLLQKTQTNFPAVQATYGDNYITLDLTTTSGCLGQGVFVLEVISDKKEKTYLRFYNEYNSCTPEGEQAPGGLGG